MYPTPFSLIGDYARQQRQSLCHDRQLQPDELRSAGEHREYYGSSGASGSCRRYSVMRHPIYHPVIMPPCQYTTLSITTYTFVYILSILFDYLHLFNPYCRLFYPYCLYHHLVHPYTIFSPIYRHLVHPYTGLEALKDARIVTGEGPNMSGWVLPEHLQETTGVVYATSFPALDAAIEEVSKFFETKTVTGDTVPNVIAALRVRLETATGPLSAAAGRRSAVYVLLVNMFPCSL